MQKRTKCCICFIIAMLTFAHTLTAPVAAAGSPPPNAVKTTKTGVLWDVPNWAKPNMDLPHPRVQHTQDGLKQARAKLADNVLWAKSIYDNVIRQADSFLFTSDQIRAFMPAQHSYFKYTDTMIPCPDGSPMTASWAKPGQVTCGAKTYPDAEHPDDGRGWRDKNGETHYFVARWNGFVVESLTGSLMSQAMAYALSRNEKYAERVAAILDALATIYPTATEGPLDYPGLRPGFEGGRLERPYFQTARVLLIYASAADLVWSSPQMDAPSITNPGLSVRDNIAYNLLLNGADYCYREANRSGYVNSLNNGTADYNKAILAVGSMLGIDRYVEWVVSGPTSLETMIKNNIDRDGLYYETTAGYTNVVRNLYLQIADMMYNLRTAAYPHGINYYDDPRFAALYMDSRERLFVAGRSPSYGDTDPDRAVGINKPIDEGAARQIIQFAVRSSDPKAQERYWALVAEGTSGIALLAAQNEWGLFNVAGTPMGVKAPERAIAGSEVLGGKGMTLLRSGDDRGAFMRYGITLSHGQRDELGILLYTNGREMAFDPGYAMAHYRVGWTHHTVSHLATVVNETSQQGSGGSLSFTTHAPGLGATEAHDEGAYAHQGVSVYRRLISLIDSTPGMSYVVDIFRVKGGRVRDYSFHSWGSSFTTYGLELGAPQPGSVGSPSYTWHDKIGVDGEVIPYRSQDFSWQAPPGNGYGFLGNPQYAKADRSWSATWDNADRRLRLFMLPSEDREVIVADAPSPMGDTKYLLAREKGDVPSQFVSVIDMSTSKLQVAGIKELSVTSAKAGDFVPVAFEVSFVNQSPQEKDVFLSSLNGAFTAQSDGVVYQTDAEFASVRRAGAGIYSMHVSKGTYLSAGDMQLAGFPKAYSGSIVSVDYKGGSILVETPEGIPHGVVGQYVLISAPEYSHSSPYQISQIENEGANTRLYLSPGTFELGQGFLAQSPSGNWLPNTTPLPYSSVVYRSSPSDYFNGKPVVNERGAITTIERVQGGAALLVGGTNGFIKDDSLTIYDIKAGDSVSIPVSVHLTQADELTYQLTSPQPVWLTLADSHQAHVYVTNDVGEFTMAEWEMRDGVRWFRAMPGKVVLQHAGRIVGPKTMKVSDAVLPTIKVSLEELGSRSAISGAIVKAKLGGSDLQLHEESTGVYSAVLPVGTSVGNYDVAVTAQKEGMAFFLHTMRLETEVDWRINAPERIEVSLGEPFSVDFAVEEPGLASFMAQATIGDQTLTLQPRNDRKFTIVGQAATTEQTIRLLVTKAGGFTQEATIHVLPGGGRVVPVATQLRAHAGQPLQVNVRFYGRDGSLLTGERIPYSQVFAGLLTSELFSDPDGDGIATTSVSNLAPGTHTLTIWADGCDMVDISAVVEMNTGRSNL